MRQIPTSPFPSGGRDPVAEAVSADYQNLFVVNQDDNTIEQFVIGSDGKLYPYNTVNTPGIYPLAIAANKSNVFVVDTYQPLPLCSTADPCRDRLPFFRWHGQQQHMLGFGVPGNGGHESGCGRAVLAAVALRRQFFARDCAHGRQRARFRLVCLRHRVRLFGIAKRGLCLRLLRQLWRHAHASERLALCSRRAAFGYRQRFLKHVCLCDRLRQRQCEGLHSEFERRLAALSGSPFPAGNQPSAVVVDPSYAYAYVANSTDDTVTAYSMSSGVLTRIGTYATGLQPVAMGIDPSTNHFLYTANFLASTVSGFELSSTDGSLLDAQFSPYATNSEPVAVAAIPHKGTGGGVRQ